MHQLLIDFRRQCQTISHAREMMDRIQIEEIPLDIPFVRDVLLPNRNPMFPTVEIYILQNESNTQNIISDFDRLCYRLNVKKID